MTFGFPNSLQKFSETSTPLGISGVFTGSTHDSGPQSGADGNGIAEANVRPERSFIVTAVSDQASAAGGLVVEMSLLSTGPWLPAIAPVALVANTPVTLQVTCLNRFYRTRLTNGGVAQTSLFIGSAFSN